MNFKSKIFRKRNISSRLFYIFYFLFFNSIHLKNNIGMCTYYPIILIYILEGNQFDKNCDITLEDYNNPYDLNNEDNENIY